MLLVPLAVSLPDGIRLSRPTLLRPIRRLGVNVGNWIEDRESVLFQKPSVGGAGAYEANSTHRTDFVPEVRLYSCAKLALYLPCSIWFFVLSSVHHSKSSSMPRHLLQGVTGDQLVIASARKDLEVSARSKFLGFSTAPCISVFTKGVSIACLMLPPLAR